MKYELNVYHRDISDKDLLADLIRVSNNNKGKYISRSLYEKEGKYSATPFLRRWGSWLGTLEKAGLRIIRDTSDYKQITDEELIADVLNVAEVLGKRTVSTKEYTENGKYKVQTLLTRFTCWNKVLEKAGLEATIYKIISDNDLYEEIERLWQMKGSQPTTTDIRNGNSIYSLNTFSRRFGGWRKALEAFLDYIEVDEYVGDEYVEEKKENNIQKRSDKVEIKKRKTPRDINLRLRFKVLKRDNFCCCACGASPAKDPNVELHIDHIIPWEKRGETELTNLQTLCSNCNLGKSNIL